MRVRWHGAQAADPSGRHGVRGDREFSQRLGGRAGLRLLTDVPIRGEGACTCTSPRSKVFGTTGMGANLRLLRILAWKPRPPLRAVLVQ